MRTTAKIGAAVAAAALAIAMPTAATAHGGPPDHPSHPSHPATERTHPSKSDKCAAHNVAYTAYGTLVSWSATSSGDGRYTGTITVAVTKTNEHAETQKGTTYTYTLTNTRVRFGKRANPPAAGDRVKVIGEITAVAKKCTDQTGAGTITVNRVDVRGPKHTK